MSNFSRALPIMYAVALDLRIFANNVSKTTLVLYLLGVSVLEMFETRLQSRILLISVQSVV